MADHILPASPEVDAPIASLELPTDSSPSWVDVALEWLDEHLMQLHSLSVVLERGLRERCADDENDPPSVEWRLAQILNDMLASTGLQDGISNLLREREHSSRPASAMEVQQ